MKTKSFLTDELLEDFVTLLDNPHIEVNQIKQEIIGVIKSDVKCEKDKKEMLRTLNKISKRITIQSYLFNLRLKHDGLGVL